MPRYNYDPSKVQSSIEVFPKDDYEFVLGSPKSFIRQNSKGEDSYGVRFSVEVAAGAYKGKRTVFTCYLHSEGAQSMSKRFQMAAYGFKSNSEGEQAFNEKFGGLDWSIDPESGSVGEAWQKMAGTRVVGVLDIGKNNQTGEPQQDFKSWRPAIAE